jgi:hypothetical protein
LFSEEFGTTKGVYKTTTKILELNGWEEERLVKETFQYSFVENKLILTSDEEIDKLVLVLEKEIK